MTWDAPSLTKTLHKVWEMWSCDWSTIQLSLTPKQLGVHDLHMDTHKLKCQHPTQTWLIFNSNNKTAINQQQTEKNQQADKKWNWGMTCARRGQGWWDSGRRAGGQGSGRQAGEKGSILGWTCVSEQWKWLQSKQSSKRCHRAWLFSQSLDSQASPHAVRKIYLCWPWHWAPRAVCSQCTRPRT